MMCRPAIFLCVVWLCAIWFGLWGSLPAEAAAAPAVEGLAPLGQPDGLSLASDFTLRSADGRMFRLAGLEAPLQPLRQPGAALWPPAHKALAALQARLDRGVVIYDAGCPPDRWGRQAVRMLDRDGRWVEGDFLEQGLMRVGLSADCALQADRLLQAESVARQAGLGLWAEAGTALKAPDQTPRWIDSVQVVEGLVTAARSTKNGIYLDFGSDWRRSLGVKIGKRLARKLPGDPLALTGHRVRVRGWIGKGVGPLMEIIHPAQIEVPDGWPPRPTESKTGDMR